ncbi:MAG: lipoate protein ligase C-terminal domain-containing protein [Candidatus Micrarchaeia archaeon]
MVQIERKVRGGKLVRVDVQFMEGRIASIRITGDFFMHPEDAIIEIERRMVGLHKDNIAEGVAEVFSSVNAEIVGFTPSDISDMISEAIDDA